LRLPDRALHFIDSKGNQAFVECDSLFGLLVATNNVVKDAIGIDFVIAFCWSEGKQRLNVHSAKFFENFKETQFGSFLSHFSSHLASFLPRLVWIVLRSSSVCSMQSSSIKLAEMCFAKSSSESDSDWSSGGGHGGTGALALVAVVAVEFVGRVDGVVVGFACGLAMGPTRFRAICCCCSGSGVLSNESCCSLVTPQTLAPSSSTWHPALLAELWRNSCRSS